MILLEHGPGGIPALFQMPLARHRARQPSDVLPMLAALQQARARGEWIAGYASYELGYVLEPRLLPLLPESRRLPLFDFATFAAPGPAEAVLARAGAEADQAGLTASGPGWAAAEHAVAMTRIARHIADGELYQANLTFPMRARWSGSALGIYGALARRQQVGFGACLTLPDGPAIVSRSPELFFATDARGRITARPMKGTAPRDADPARDAALARALRASEKNRAENLMIVDLLRNDLARLCDAGSVQVPALFMIESYATLHQMVSTIEGALCPGVTIAELLTALFPCGSVTGAPKISAMEIIRAAEPEPRGIYCGAIGWFAPDGSSAFNVAIRTLTLHADGEARFGVGGGIVADSTAAEEYEEALWKARFAAI